MEKEIKPNYVNFEQANWLKEKGFNMSVEGLFFDGEFMNIFPKKANNTDFASTRYNSAPEQWQVVEWLRVNYDIWIDVTWGTYHNKNVWYYDISKIGIKSQNNITICISPQEAYSAAFSYIKENNLI